MFVRCPNLVVKRSDVGATYGCLLRSLLGALPPPTAAPAVVTPATIPAKERGAISVATKATEAVAAARHTHPSFHRRTEAEPEKNKSEKTEHTKHIKRRKRKKNTMILFVEKKGVLLLVRSFLSEAPTVSHGSRKTVRTLAFGFKIFGVGYASGIRASAVRNFRESRFSGRCLFDTKSSPGVPWAPRGDVRQMPQLGCQKDVHLELSICAIPRATSSRLSPLR